MEIRRQEGFGGTGGEGTPAEVAFRGPLIWNLEDGRWPRRLLG